MRIRVKMDLGGAFLKLLKAKGKPDFRPALQKMGALVWRSVLKNFEVGGRPPWKPLSPVTLKRWLGSRTTPHRKTWWTESGQLTKRAKGYLASRKPLMDTGALRRSVRVERVEPDRVILAAGGGPVNYARLHQYGGKIGKGHKVYVPARPYMVAQPEDKERFKEILLKRLHELYF